MEASTIGPEICLYNLTLKPSTTTLKACIGNFRGNKKQQEVAKATNSSIELWKLNRNTGLFVKLISQQLFSNVRSIQNFKITGSSKDYLIVTTDSGNLSILQFNNDTNQFESASNEPYFKTGISRISPGEYIGVDGQSRAVMIAAIEKNKLAYTFRRDSNEKLIVSSPLEASKSRQLTFDLCGLDVGFENPLFVAIECDYGNISSNLSTVEKSLNYYELDLGLNHIIKKYSDEIPSTSNFLIPIPGGIDGPSGVLVCSENMIQYRFLSKMTHRVPIPRRNNQTVPSQIVSGVVHKIKNSFFVLLQSNLGDLYKVTFDSEIQDSDESEGGGVVNSMEISYFDSISVCSSLIIFKSGFMYASSQSGDQYIYQFEKLGDDPGYKWNSVDFPDELAVLEEKEVYFDLKEEDNIRLISIIENLNPLIDAKLYDSGNASDLPVIYSLCGSGPKSTLKIINHELRYTEHVSQELPSHVIKVFATKTHIEDIYDKFVVLSFFSGTLILGLGDDVEEVENSGFNTDLSTIDVQQIGSKSLVQIHSSGFKQIFYSESDEPEKEVDWTPPAGIEVLHSSCTNTQIVLALSNRELVYFEVDEFDRLIEYSETKEMEAQISSITLGDVPSGHKRFPFIVVGCTDQTLTVLRTDPDSTLEVAAKESLSSNASSLVAMYCKTSTFGSFEEEEDDSTDSFSNGSSTLYLHAGLESGVYARLQLDSVTGELSNPRNKYTGPKAVTLCKLRLGGKNTVGIMSTRSYIGYPTDDLKITALSKKNPCFNYMCSFETEAISKNGTLGIDGENVVFLTIDQLATDMLTESIELRYTPKAMADCTELNGMLYIVESDYNVKSPYLKDIQNSQQEEIISYGGGDEEEEEEEVDDEDESKDPNPVLIAKKFGYEFSEGSWGSCIQVVSPEEKGVGQTIELVHESVFKVCQVMFESQPDDIYLVVSSSSNQKLAPNSNSGSYLRTYRINTDGSLEFVHKTETESLALSIIQFQGKLLAGMGGRLTLFDIGFKQLLKKGSVSLRCNQIVDIQTQGFRVVVSDIRDSVRYVVYKPLENLFIEFIDDSIQRHVTKSLMLDYETTLLGDKFGSIAILRCPQDVSNLSDEDNHGALIAGKGTKFNGTSYRLNNLVNFYLGDIPTSFQKGALSIGGSESIVYTCLQGKIGCLYAIKTLREINFFKELQKQILNELDVLTGRDYLKYRGYYIPVKNCIDGDLMEEYFRINGEKRLRIANSMERLPREIDRRISEMRSRVAY